MPNVQIREGKKLYTGVLGCYAISIDCMNYSKEFLSVKNVSDFLVSRSRVMIYCLSK